MIDKRAIFAEIESYDSLIDCFRARADDLDISRESIDQIGGLADRHTSKILGPARTKRLGRISLGALLGALSLKLVAVHDPQMFERNRSRYVPRDHANIRGGHTRSKKG